MFNNTIPLFKRGRTLKVEMLDSLRDFPRDFLDIMMKDRSDGIISGCSLKVRGDKIIIEPGIIKHRGMLYMLHGDKEIKYTFSDDTAYLKIRFLEVREENDASIYESEIYIDKNPNIRGDEMEFCRFKVKQGAVLRRDYVSFKDMMTHFDTVNIVNAPHSAFGKPSISPEVLKNFAREAFQFNINHSMDAAFCLMCINEDEFINRETILRYLNMRLIDGIYERTNEDIFRSLEEILCRIKEGTEQQSTERRSQRKRIFVE